MKMAKINSDCKSHIRTLVGTNGYMTPQEWDNYCKTFVEKYKVLQNEGILFWVRNDKVKYVEHIVVSPIQILTKNSHCDGFFCL